MADERSNAKPARRQLSGSLLSELRTVIAAHVGPSTDDSGFSRAMRAIGERARAEGIRAEQLVTALKRVFDAVTPPPTLASHEARTKRLATLVTICVREYYASLPDAISADPSPTFPS